MQWHSEEGKGKGRGKRVGVRGEEDVGREKDVKVLEFPLSSLGGNLLCLCV